MRLNQRSTYLGRLVFLLQLCSGVDFLWFEIGDQYKKDTSCGRKRAVWKSKN